MGAGQTVQIYKWSFGVFVVANIRTGSFDKKLVSMGLNQNQSCPPILFWQTTV